MLMNRKHNGTIRKLVKNYPKMTTYVVEFGWYHYKSCQKAPQNVYKCVWSFDGTISRFVQTVSQNDH
jgi:hypothetical protein